MISEPITQVPGFKCGARPPATPKLINPPQPAAIACVSREERFFPSPPQITGTPRPAAMRASNFIPTTTIIRSRPPRDYIPKDTTRLLPLFKFLYRAIAHSGKKRGYP